jgi:tRNA A-37 threonylcarbamoyl transferase component Bud32
MTDSTPTCAGCGRTLDPDDRFCSKCGTPTVDVDATLVVGTGPDDGGAPVGGRTAGVTVSETAAAPPSTAADFNTRFRHVLGAEYELLSLLGQGGFARVYKARDRRLDRIVAIKVIRPDVVGNRLFVESFRNEGVALAKLRHPGIVPIYDIRERGGLIYYIMPFVQGTSLEARLARGRLPPYESRRILSELTEALSAAHRAKMVHLDIKPANVFLEGDLGKVLLMDFGTALKVTDQVEEGSRRAGRGHAGVHVARAGPRAAGDRPPFGHLLHRRPWLLHAHGPAAVRREERPGDPREARQGSAGAHPRRQSHDPQGIRGRGHAVSGEGPLEAVLHGQGAGGRAGRGDVPQHARDQRAAGGAVWHVSAPWWHSSPPPRSSWGSWQASSSADPASPASPTSRASHEGFRPSSPCWISTRCRTTDPTGDGAGTDSRGRMRIRTAIATVMLAGGWPRPAATRSARRMWSVRGTS